jgi:diguanylate cyclase (GGDEF)-like protein
MLHHSCKNVMERVTGKTEESQSLTRIILLHLLTIYYFFTDDHTILLFLGAGYLLFSVGWGIWVHLKPCVPLRKYISLVLDLCVTFGGLWVAGPHHTGLFLLFCWVVLGYGYRYGANYVLYGGILGFVLIVQLLIFNPIWAETYSHIVEFLFIYSLVMVFKYQILFNLEEEIQKRTISEIKVKSIQDKIMKDSLTGLANREYAEMWLQKKHKDNTRVGVLFLDLDRFKDFNDNYGHLIGDKVLINISKRLNNCIRENDMVCRFAGDEFIILINDEDTDAINEVAQRVVASLNQSVEIQTGERLTVTGSVGIAILGIHGNTPTDVLRNADAAMYMAKRKGRNRIAWFEEKVKG